MLAEYEKVHAGGTSLASLTALSKALNSPLTEPLKFSWLSGDTVVWRRAHSPDLPRRMLDRKDEETLADAYLEAFVRRLAGLRF